MAFSLYNFLFEPSTMHIDLLELNPLEKLFLKKITRSLSKECSVFNHMEVEIENETRGFNFIIVHNNGKKTGIEFEEEPYYSERKIAPGEEKIPPSCQLDSMYRFTSPNITPFLDDCIFFIYQFDADLFDNNKIYHGRYKFSDSVLSVIQYEMGYERGKGYGLSLIIERKTKNQPWPSNRQYSDYAGNQINYEPNFKLEEQKPVAKSIVHEKPDNFETILERFMVKSRTTPNWRYPFYDTLFSFVYFDDVDAILADFKKANAEDPDGFFMEKEALYALGGEKTGRFPKGLYLYYKQIEVNQNLTGQRKLEIATEITQNVPGFAPGWLALAALLPEPKDQLDAIEHGLSANPDQTTKGLLLLHKAFSLSASGQNKMAISHLAGIIGNPEMTSGNVATAKMVLRHFTKIESNQLLQA
jgi:hypothetical protein